MKQLRLSVLFLFSLMLTSAVAQDKHIITNTISRSMLTSGDLLGFGFGVQYLRNTGPSWLDLGVSVELTYGSQGRWSDGNWTILDKNGDNPWGVTEWGDAFDGGRQLDPRPDKSIVVTYGVVASFRVINTEKNTLNLGVQLYDSYTEETYIALREYGDYVHETGGDTVRIGLTIPVHTTYFDLGYGFHARYRYNFSNRFSLGAFIRVDKTFYREDVFEHAGVLVGVRF